MRKSSRTSPTRNVNLKSADGSPLNPRETGRDAESAVAPSASAFLPYPEVFFAPTRGLRGEGTAIVQKGESRSRDAGGGNRPSRPGRDLDRDAVGIGAPRFDGGPRREGRHGVRPVDHLGDVRYVGGVRHLGHGAECARRVHVVYRWKLHEPPRPGESVSESVPLALEVWL
jgi:hypothetical protein